MIAVAPRNRFFNTRLLRNPLLHRRFARRDVKVVSKKLSLNVGLSVYPAKTRVTDGARTRDLRDHNPMLCQLSYGHQAVLRFYQHAPAVQNAQTITRTEPDTG